MYIFETFEDSEELYFPVAQSPFPAMTLVVRHESGETLVAAVRGEVRKLAPGLPVSGILGMDQVVAASVAQPKLIMTLTGVFAFMALLLAAIGNYAVMSFTVSLRTREMGIRLALGAKRSDILRVVLGEGARLTLIGLGLGLAATFGTTRLLAALLFGVSPMDQPTILVAALLLAAFGLLACYLPARRALSVDPLAALRQE